MKKLALIIGVLSIVACTDQKIVNYNTARLDKIENYLSNKPVKNGENVEVEYLSLEKEAEKWQRERAQQQ